MSDEGIKAVEAQLSRIEAARNLPEAAVLSAAAAPMAVAVLEQAAAAASSELLQACVTLWRRIVAATPADDSNRPAYLAMLGVALQIRFERTGTASDLAEAVEMAQRAAEATPAGHRDLPRQLANLGAALQRRYDQVGGISGLHDLDAAVDAYRRAVAASPPGDPGHASFLSSLGAALRVRFDRTGDLGDLAEAVGVCRQAMAVAKPDDPYQVERLNSLALALRARFGITDATSDLAECIDLLGEALARTPASHSNYAAASANLAAALWVRFGHTGADEDLDRSIDLLRQAVVAAPPGHVLHAMALSNLAVAVWGRHQRTGAAADLDAAIDIGRQAIAAGPAGQVNLPRTFANLGIALRERFESAGAKEDIEEAVEVSRHALATTAAGDPDRPRRLSNLGNTLRQQFLCTGAAEDLDQAVHALRRAAAGFPAGHPDRCAALANLGNAMQTSFERTGSTSDLDEAIDLMRESVRLVPADHPSRDGFLANLGNAVRARFRRTTSKADRAEALSAFTAVAHGAAAPSLRARAACAAALLTENSRVDDAARLWTTAVHLLPVIAPRHLGRRDQQGHLGDFAGVAANAAALALLDIRSGESAAERAARALGLLEAGRGILLSQALDTRNDLTDLFRHRPSLAARYARLRDLLDRDTELGVDAAESAGSDRTALRLEQESGDRHRLAAEFEATVAEIRGLDGFTRFMLPPQITDLLPPASSGTVVVLNVSVYRCDALLVTSEGVTCTPLPELTADALQLQIELFRRAVALRTVSGANGDAVADAEKMLLKILEWLWDVVAGPVMAALGADCAPGPREAWPRVCWVPSGLLCLLPLHAAGYHIQTASGTTPRSVMDRVISSYAPSVRTLHYARKASSAPTQPMRSLIVAMPTTPDTSHAYDLPGVAEEAEQLRTVLPNATILMQRPYPDGLDPVTVSGAPTKAEVIGRLAGCAIAHFACHGTTDPVDPSRSGLLLGDHRTAPFSVAGLAPVRLDAARLAYLSACSTALNKATELADESIHLTSAFQLAGFPQVVGTLWEIDDYAAAAIAREFYGQLRTGTGAFDPDKAAEALHHIGRRLRDEEPQAPFLWAAHVHAGA